MKELLNKIAKHRTEHELMPPLNQIDLSVFQRNLNYKLPSDYVELLKHFNGGELFIPGTIIYGIHSADNYYSITEVNNDDIRKDYSLPVNYLIVAKLNFGDLICFDKVSNTVIQWDHENNEEFMKWNTFTEWLTDNINDFLSYEEGEK